MLHDLNSYILLRLVLAAFLGGLIGLERQLRRKPAGIRTNMLICFGAALFTVISYEMAGTVGGDRRQQSAGTTQACRKGASCAHQPHKAARLDPRTEPERDHAPRPRRAAHSITLLEFGGYRAGSPMLVLQRKRRRTVSGQPPLNFAGIQRPSGRVLNASTPARLS